MTPDIEKKIRAIHSQYPWVSESTLSAILSDTGEGVKILIDMIKEVEETEDNFEEAAKVTKDKNKVVISLGRGVEKFKEYLKDYSGDKEQIVETAAKHVQDFGGAALKGTKKLADFAPSENKFTTAFRGTIGAGEMALGGFTGAMILFGKLAMEQEKSLRVMIDYGIIAGDTSLYTTMRQNFASIGMTVNNGMEQFKDFVYLFANTKGTIIENINTFSLMTNMLKSDESLADMGESYEGIMRGLVGHAETLYGVGRFNELNMSTQRRLIERFQESASVSGALAETLGYKRADQEARKKEASQDIDFRRSLIANSSFIIENYGQEAYDNIVASQEEIVSLSHQVFGPEFSNDIKELLNRMVNDIHRGGDATNAITEEMNTMLNMFGPHVRSSFIHMLNNSVKGDFSRSEAANSFRLFTKELKEGPDLDITGINNPITTKAKMLKDMAEVAPPNFVDISTVEFYRLIDTVGVFSEQSDDAIDAVDMMKSTFAEISSMLLPGFETMGDALALFEKMYSGIGLQIAGFVEALTPDADDGPDDLNSAVPPRPHRFRDMNGFLPTSQNHPMRKWDKAYGDTHNHDGSAKASTVESSGTNPTSRTVSVGDLPPLGDNIHGGGGIIMKNQGKIRGEGINEKLAEVLQVAAFEIGVNVEVHSGGQMTIAEAESLGAIVKGKTYYVNDKKVRTGSTRHDAGMAADIDLVDAKDGHKLDMTNDMDMARIYEFTKLVKALGLTGIGAGDMHSDGVDAYMGKHRLHVGYGVEAAWGDGSTYNNAPQWLKNLYDTRSSEYVETGSMSVTDENLKANKSDVVPTEVTEPNIVEDEVVQPEASPINPEERNRVPSSSSSSRPLSVNSMETIPSAYETNALDAISEDNYERGIVPISPSNEISVEEPQNNFTQLNPEDRIRVRSSTSSSRPSNISSRSSIPQSFETNALDAFSSDSQLRFLDSSNDRQLSIIDQINSMIYDDGGNYIGDSLSRDEGQTVMNLVDRLEKEDDLYKSLIVDDTELPSSYIKSELDKSEELLSVLSDVIDQIEKVETQERAVE